MAEAPDSPIPATTPLPDKRVHNGETTSSPTPTIPASGPVAPSAASSPVTELFFASIHPGPDLPLAESCKDFARAVLAYEKLVGCPVWVLLQNESSSDNKDTISEWIVSELIAARKEIASGEKICLILHTLGGNPHAGYRLATFLQKRTGGFEIVIPTQAKSAGTLIALGAMKITMGEMAELGPLDMQVKDLESDLWDSALNETKSLQTLSREAFLLYAEKMEVMRSLYARKAFETKNRIATDFVNEMIKPLVEKIDAVHYTKMARIMEIMKKYGLQLMKRAGYSERSAEGVIQSLGEEYPDHSYIIDSREAKDLGLRADYPKAELAPLIEDMGKVCGSTTVLGRITRSTKK
jgi:Serine dehydrogenase proteinase